MSAEGVLADQAQLDKGENARMASFVGAIAVADLVKTTLGPKGMDKILQSVGGPDNSITVTNDGATILRSLYIENPAAKVLVDIARIQDETVGDGTTSVAVLCGELLRGAEQLVEQNIHPQTIIEGWRMATNIAREALEGVALDPSNNEEQFHKDLLNIAKTTLSSKLLNQEKEHFANLAVNAILRVSSAKKKGGAKADAPAPAPAVAGSFTEREDSDVLADLDYIQILKKAGGQLRDSYLEDGFILNKKIGVGQPKKLEGGVKILIANTAMDSDKIKIYGSRVRVDSMNKVAEIEEAEKDKMRAKCQKIIDVGIDCFINRQLIYNFPEEIFAKAGIMAIEHADFDGVERLAAVTGGEIASTFDYPDQVQLGHCQTIEEIMIGEDRMIRFGGCGHPVPVSVAGEGVEPTRRGMAGRACTVVLRGASFHVLDEAERSLHDALCVIQQTLATEHRTVCGGGCTEVLMAAAIDAKVPSVPGKRALAMEAFAKALRQLPTIIADNAGLDSGDLISKLRAAHTAGQKTMGIDILTGDVGDMVDLGVRESFKSKLQVLVSAAEAAEMILRVDDIIKCAPRERR